MGRSWAPAPSPVLREPFRANRPGIPLLGTEVDPLKKCILACGRDPHWPDAAQPVAPLPISRKCAALLGEIEKVAKAARNRI